MTDAALTRSSADTPAHGVTMREAFWVWLRVAVLSFGGRRQRLGRRHSELLVLLLAHPEGRTGDQLGLDLYADDLNPVTVRAELSRLQQAALVS